MWDPYAEFQSTKLPNGLTVYAAHWPKRSWENMGFLVHSGAESDPIGFEGLAHFVEHLVSENANVTKNEMASFFEEYGGEIDLGMTDYSGTYYKFSAPNDKTILAKAISMFGHMLLFAKLEKFVERERRVVISEFRRDYPIKFKLDLDKRQYKALYAGYWLERFVSPLGTPESVRRITMKELQEHYDTHYTPANISVVGVGGLKLSELVELLSQSPLATDKTGERNPLPIPVTDFAPLSENRYILHSSKHIIDPSESGRYRSISKIPGNVNICLTKVFCEMFNEVLEEEVREKRTWAYSIESSYTNFRHFYTLVINCKGLDVGAVDEIESVVETCIDSMASREELFEKTKRRTIVKNSLVDETGETVCRIALDELADNHRIISIREFLNNVKQTTMDDVLNLLKWFKPENRWTLIVKP